MNLAQQLGLHLRVLHLMNKCVIISASTSALSGTNTIQQGDYITMQSYPVLTQGFPNTADIDVQRVG